jgi:hypothetical protein
VCEEKIGGTYYMKLNPESLYEKVLGRNDPWISQFAPEGSDMVGSMFSDSFRGQNISVAQPPQSIEVLLECSLKEFFLGSIKQF